MRAPTAPSLLSLCALALSACTASESSATTPEPSQPNQDLVAARPISEAEATHHTPPKQPEKLSAEDLVQVELGRVDDASREALAKRLGPESPLAKAEALLAVHYSIADHWHIYWTNPGESGLRTRIAIEAKGAEAAEVVYPAPERLVAQGGQVTYGWGESAVLFVPLQSLGESPELTLTTRYLVCRESCIPGKLELEAKLDELPTRDDPATQAMLARVPEPAGQRVGANWADGRLVVRPTGETEAELVQFFPYASDAAVLGAQEHEASNLVLHYRFTQPPPAELAQGVLEARVAGEPVWLELATAWPRT